VTSHDRKYDGREGSCEIPESVEQVVWMGSYVLRVSLDPHSYCDIKDNIFWDIYRSKHSARAAFQYNNENENEYEYDGCRWNCSRDFS
jgi:hypothetical protein